MCLHDPSALENPFYLLAPEIIRLPLVLLATLATVIASQAVISGAYSLARQCMQMSFLPRLTVRHTSLTEEGQIFLPQVNSTLLVGVLLLVLAFRSSDALAAAYGIAVTSTFICTSLLAMVVFRRRFGWSRLLAVSVFGFFMIIDTVFFAANLLKVPEGGWVPLVLGLALLAMMTSWKSGRELMIARWRQESLPLASFLKRLPHSRTLRVPGIAVFLTGTPEYVPTSLLHNLKHNKVLHERVVFVTVQTLDVPEASAAERTSVEELSPNVHRVTLRYGFMESPNIPRALEELRDDGVRLRSDAVEFLPRARGAGPRHGAETAEMAAVPVPPDGAQCRPGDGVLPHSQRPRGRARGPGRDLNPRGFRALIAPCLELMWSR